MRTHNDLSRPDVAGPAETGPADADMGYTRRWLCGALLLAAGLSGGCASFSNPTLADSIPVHRLPPEVFGKPREEEKTIPLTLLRQKPAEIYLFEPGDVLGIYIEAVLGEKDKPPPVQFPVATVVGQTAPQPSVGYPILVQED